jgi:hypothetical protein
MIFRKVIGSPRSPRPKKARGPARWFGGCSLIYLVLFLRDKVHLMTITATTTAPYSLPSINVNPQDWIKVNIYRGVNS